MGRSCKHVVLSFRSHPLRDTTSEVSLASSTRDREGFENHKQNSNHGLRALDAINTAQKPQRQTAVQSNTHSQSSSHSSFQGEHKHQMSMCGVALGLGFKFLYQVVSWRYIHKCHYIFVFHSVCSVVLYYLTWNHW